MRNLPGHLNVYMTADGSPTLMLKRADHYGEKMHHSGGALSESLYIYKMALDEVLTRGWPLRVVSVGLGLAYNELITLAALTEDQIERCDIYSFEVDCTLIEGFQNWLNQDVASSELADVYRRVAASVARAFDLTTETLRSRAKTALNTGRLELRGAFPERAEDLHDIHLVYFDAFSNKMSPEMWQESALIETWQRNLAANCVLATYARTGGLNRVLKKLGFELLPKSGFMGKRESTLAIRVGP